MSVWLPRLCTALACLGLVLVAAAAREWAHPDCAMYLYTAELMLDGQVPYVDFVEVNPPLIMYLSVVPVALARMLGAYPIVVFNVLVSLLAVWGALWLLRYLPRVVPSLGEPSRHLVAISWLAFSFWVLIAGPRVDLPTVATGCDYGQREHLLVLGLLPLLLLRWARWEDPRRPIGLADAIVAGVAGGLTCALKPPFVLVPLVIELHGLLARRRWRALRAPELAAAGAVGIAYAAHLAFVPASMREAFLDRWLPLALERYQQQGAASWQQILELRSVHATALCVLVFVLPWAERYRRMVRSVYPLASLALGGVLAMLAQRKGWYYHVIPIQAAVWMTVTLLAAQVLDDRRAQSRLFAFRPTLLALALMAWPVSVAAHSPEMFRRYRSPTIDFVRAHSEPRDAVLYLHTSVTPPFPELLLAQRRPGSRYLWTFPIGYLFAGAGETGGEVPEARRAEAAALVAELIEDVRTRRPAVILVWRGPNAFCPSGAYLPRLLADRGFDDALVGYERASGPAGWEAYLRSPDPDARPAPSEHHLFQSRPRAIRRR